MASSRKTILPAACFDLRWIAAGLVLLLLGTLAWGLFGPEPPIRVARETTYFTAPLAAHGLPDYEAAMLAGYGPAPPPEDNAAVLLLETCWPLGINGWNLPLVCKALGIADPPPADPLRLDPAKDAAAGIDDAMLDTAGEWPWTTEQLPAVAAWLTKHETQIDRRVAAADRPCYWLPSPSLLNWFPGDLVNSLLPDLPGLRGMARVLGYRARWHIAENRPAAAWRDIMAIRRLARLLTPPGRGPQFLATQVVPIALDATADAVTRQLLAMPDLPADVLATIRRDLEELGPPVCMADGLAGQRIMGTAATWSPTGCWLRSIRFFRGRSRPRPATTPSSHSRRPPRRSRPAMPTAAPTRLRTPSGSTTSSPSISPRCRSIRFRTRRSSTSAGATATCWRAWVTTASTTAATT